MVFLLRLSGLDISDKVEEIHFKDKNFPDFDRLQEVIAEASTYNDKVKLKRISDIIETVFTEIYFK